MTQNKKPQYTIFKEYDIRGNFGANLLLEDFSYIADRIKYLIQSPESFIGKKKIGKKKINRIVGELQHLRVVDLANQPINFKPPQYTAVISRDCRPSSQQIADCVIASLRQSGIDVIDLNISPVFMMNFAVLKLNADIGFMVTASHNHLNDNGLKITLGANPVGGVDLLSLRNFHGYSSSKLGKYRQKSLEEDYIDLLINDIKIPASTSIVWDCGDGTTVSLLNNILSKIPQIKSIIINKRKSKNSRVNPSPRDQNRIDQIKQLIVENSANMGIAFDEDGDRIMVIDNQGNIRKSDELLMFLAKQIVDQNDPKNQNITKPKTHPIVIGDIYTAPITEKYITKLGLQFCISKVGHSNIKRAIISSGALLAGENSGHFYFADRYFGYDDAVYAAFRLIEATKGQKLTEALKDIPKVFTTKKIILNSKQSNKKKIMRFIQNIIELECQTSRIYPITANNINDIFGYFDNKNTAIINEVTQTETKANLHIIEDDEQIETWPKISYLDGIRVDYPDYWFAIRPSNTENHISAIGGGACISICSEIEIYLDQLLKLALAGAK